MTEHQLSRSTPRAPGRRREHRNVGKLARAVGQRLQGADIEQQAMPQLLSGHGLHRRQGRAGIQPDPGALGITQLPQPAGRHPQPVGRKWKRPEAAFFASAVIAGGAGKGEGITLSWQVEDVREARDRLAAMGVETSPVEWRYGAWVIYICDPAGNRIELWS